MKRTKGLLSERIPQDFLLRRHPPPQISGELKLLASHKLVSGYFHLSGSPSPFWRGESDSFKIFTSHHAPLRFWFPSPEGRGARGEVISRCLSSAVQVAATVAVPAAVAVPVCIAEFRFALCPCRPGCDAGLRSAS